MGMLHFGVVIVRGPELSGGFVHVLDGGGCVCVCVYYSPKVITWKELAIELNFMFNIFR